MTDVCTCLASECEHGQWAALVVFYKLSQVQDPQTRAALLADAIGNLIDLDLSWERMALTLARLQGFAAGLMPLLEPGLAAMASPVAGACAASSAPSTQAGEVQ